MERPGGPLTGNLVEKLSREDRARLGALGRSRVLEAGAVLVRQGSVGDCLFILEEGELAVVRSLPGDDEEVLLVARPGMILGEMAVLDGGVRAASLRAVGHCVVRVIGVGAFDALTLHQGEAGLRILRAVASMVHERLESTCGGATAAATAQERSSRLQWGAPTSEVPELLGVLPAFATLDATERESLMRHAAVAALPRAEEVVLPDGEAVGVTLVLRGALSRWRDREAGPNELRPVAGPGAFADYAAALGLGRGAWRWRTRSATRLLRLDARLFDADSPYAARLLHALSRDLATQLRRATGLKMHFEMAWAHEARRPRAKRRVLVREA